MIIIHYRAVFLFQMMPHCFIWVEAAMVFQSGTATKAVPVVHVRIHLSKTRRALDKTNVFRPKMFNGFPNIIYIFIMLVAWQGRLRSVNCQMNSPGAMLLYVAHTRPPEAKACCRTRYLLDMMARFRCKSSNTTGYTSLVKSRMAVSHGKLDLDI